jgi:hypothetical protein
MTTVAQPDFLDVQLTTAGIALAAPGSTVRIANGHFSYVFTGGKPVRVLSSEWRRVLSLKTFEGAPILAVVPTVATPSAAATPKTATARVISPAASHTDAPAQPETSTASSEVK